MKKLRIDKLQKQITRTGEYGDFTIQGGEGFDFEHNMKVRIVFNNQPDATHLVGATIMVTDAKEGFHEEQPQVSIVKKSKFQIIEEAITQPAPQGFGTGSKQPAPQTPTAESKTPPSTGIDLTEALKAAAYANCILKELKETVSNEHDRVVLAEKLAITILINGNKK